MNDDRDGGLKDFPHARADLDYELKCGAWCCRVPSKPEPADGLSGCNTPPGKLLPLEGKLKVKQKPVALEEC